MSFQSDVFDNLGQVLMPEALAFCLPDLCTIQALNLVSDGAGGYTQGTPTTAYSSVPCAYEPLSGARFDTNGKLLSINAYRVTLPTHSSVGTRINLDPTVHRILVAARGNEPTKTFRIVSIADDYGVVFEVLTEREN